MPGRVLYSDPATSRDLATLPYEELGAVDNGVWLECPDETLRALADRRPPVFLYFHKHDYDVAVAGLGPARTQEVIRLRRDRWAPQAKSFLQWALFEGERAALEGGLRLSAGRVESEPVERPLRLLQRMAGLERYQSVPARAMAITVLQGEAMLMAATKSVLEKYSDTLTPDDRHLLSVHQDRRQIWAEQVARATAALGATEFENTLPFADPSRAVFVCPTDGDLEKDLSRSGEPPVRWRGGLVFVTAERSLKDLRQGDRSAAVLYADSGEFYDGLETLTESQLHRDFAARLEQPAAGRRLDFLGHIDKLHLHQILMKRELRGRADAARACEHAGFDTMIREDTMLLGYSLARNETFSRSQGMDGLAPNTLFQTAWNAVAADLASFANLSRKYWPGALPGLEALEALQSGNGN